MNFHGGDGDEFSWWYFDSDYTPIGGSWGRN